MAFNESPDVGFDASINPYRGCEHGCVYCYARPTHEYLGLSAGLDFETKIFVKPDAPALLTEALSSPHWLPQTIALSGVTDPYQPLERELQLTRRCLQVLAEFRNPVFVITKNHLVTRDLDILRELAEHEAAAVFLSITTLDETLTGSLEPRTSRPQRRLAAIAALSDAGIPVGVMVAPVIPGLNDHEIPHILQEAKRAGAQCARYILLRLPYGVGDLFGEWLARHFPDRKNRVLNRIRSTRAGKLYDSKFKTRMRGEGVFAEQVSKLFAMSCAKVNLNGPTPRLSTQSFRRAGKAQLSLF
ncbi:MAG: PA0069 family radical SAM protein [Terriglobia bacterium]